MSLAVVKSFGVFFLIPTDFSYLDILRTPADRRQQVSGHHASSDETELDSFCAELNHI